MPTRLRTLFSALFLSGAVPLATAAPMVLADYLALSGPAPSGTFAYGSAPSQFAELFRPAGPGPFPVVVLIHGGCWTVEFGGIKQMHNVAGALAARGIAVWNVEYRRVDEEGGGYPGTYQDINAALDKLAAEAPRQQLDTARIVAVGHSAGGQLAQWIVGRSRIPATSPLFQAQPLPIRQVISLGGLADLRNEKELIKTSCGREMVQLAGTASAIRPDIYADTNAAELVPNGSTTVLITGEHDTISPPRAAHDFARRARAAGDRAEVVILPGASHYDEIAASSPAWKLILPEIERALGIVSLP
ncbi:S9 family peptidase [Massilia sp. CF038]|uniref:alpha/beta hydrolase family protein n=1 Tax=Massilia sp. CF038 TaxID=1881045 RepID=UPI000919080D|nr:alpha/beta hydrolase [Massilia sp. CF038]SHH04343.1 Acetyl esterase/lipase [Massilia sp. CF038]